MDILVILSLGLVLLSHILIDFDRQRMNKPILHWLSAMLVFAVSVFFGFLVDVIVGVAWWKFTILSLCVHLAVFDPLWNLLHNNYIFYQGDPNNPNRAFTDKIWDRVPPLGQIFFRIWVILVGLAIFSHWALIVGHN